VRETENENIEKVKEKLRERVRKRERERAIEKERDEGRRRVCVREREKEREKESYIKRDGERMWEKEREYRGEREGQGEWDGMGRGRRDFEGQMRPHSPQASKDRDLKKTALSSPINFLTYKQKREYLSYLVVVVVLKTNIPKYQPCIRRNLLV
jgi:hypothetical protein